MQCREDQPWRLLYEDIGKLLTENVSLGLSDSEDTSFPRSTSRKGRIHPEGIPFPRQIAFLGKCIASQFGTTYSRGHSEPIF